jgi:archaemetzincin
VREIRILPLGHAQHELVEQIRGPLEETFRVPVIVDHPSIDMARFFDTERAQYNSTRLLEYLKVTYSHALHTRGRRSRFGHKTLGIAAQDLFTPILTYVFGEAELAGDVAVVSYHRLENERYGLSPDPALLRERLRKEALHELGHTYGLVHCADQSCVMHTSTYVEDIDVKGEKFCQVCHRLICHG